MNCEGRGSLSMSPSRTLIKALVADIHDEPPRRPPIRQELPWLEDEESPLQDTFAAVTRNALVRDKLNHPAFQEQTNRRDPLGVVLDVDPGTRENFRPPPLWQEAPSTVLEVPSQIP